MKFIHFILLFAVIGATSSCKTGKKLKAAEAQYKSLSDQYVALESKLTDCETANNEADKRQQSKSVGSYYGRDHTCNRQKD